MGIRVECDWCRETIDEGMSYVTLAVDGKVGSTDVSAPAKVLCGGTGDTRNCGQRLLAMLDGNEGARVDMGYEWQLVAISSPTPETPALVGRQPGCHRLNIDKGLEDFINSFASSWQQRYYRACKKAGISTLEQMASLDEDSFVALEDFGPTSWGKLREFVAAREQAPAKPADEPDGEIMYDVIPAEYGNNYRVRRGYRVFMPNNLPAMYLHRKGVRTVEDLRRAIADGSIYQVGAVGPKTVARMVLALERHAQVTA